MKLREETGAAAVELAITAPAILLLLAAMLAGGRMVTAKTSLESVAREAARAATQEPDGASAMQRAEVVARQEASLLGLDPNRLIIEQHAGEFARGDSYVVELSYRVGLADLPGFRLIPPFVTVSAKQVETIERYKSR